MKARLRRLEQESVYDEIFDLYEREQNRLAREVERLLNENIALQENQNINTTETPERREKYFTLKKALNEVRNENKELKLANMELRRQERYVMLFFF